MPLSKLNILAFEIGTGCDMAKVHCQCPVNIKNKKPYRLTIDKIVETAHKARELGFDGLLAWHLWNEPLIYWDKIKTAHKSLEDFNHLLWTNGNFLKEEHVPYFHTIHVSNYYGHDFSNLVSKYPETRFIIRNVQLDDRLSNEDWGFRSETVFCTRPEIIECQIDNCGELHLCCMDWNAKTEIGNIFEKDFKDIVTDNLVPIYEALRGHKPAPALCQRCPHVYRDTKVF